jgi:hypothetical protein
MKMDCNDDVVGNPRSWSRDLCVFCAAHSWSTMSYRAPITLLYPC